MPAAKKLSNFKGILGAVTSVFSISGVTGIFSLAFYILWTLIGLFILLVIVQGVRQGAYSGLFGIGQKAQPTSEVQAPAGPEEVDLEGVGTVNVSCVRQALSSQSLQTLIESKDKSFLQGEEKDKFEKCIVAAPTSPSPSPDKS